MTYFENYDISEWLDKCLSRHPRPSSRARVSREREQSPAKNLLLPIVSAGALFAAQHACLAINMRGSRVANMSMQSDSERIRNADGVYWIGSLRVPPLASDFDGRVTDICRQLRAGRIVDVPARTLELAAAIHQREPAPKPSIADGWITELAKAVAKLTD